MADLTPAPSLSRGTTLAARRRRIANACDFCREHRVRCEAATPCPPCLANNVPCRRSRPVHTRKSPQKTAQLGSKNEVPRQHLGDLTPASNHSAADPSASPSPSTNLAWTSHKTDSILGFIARLNSFCSGVSQLFPDGPASSADNLPLDQISPFPSRVPEGTRNAQCDLSPSQMQHLMRIFWHRLRPLMPIVEWKDLDIASQHTPLQDAITAVTLQYIHCSGLHSKLVGLNWPQFQIRQSPVDMPYFQRSLSAVTQLATFAGPSLSAIQCYCYLTVYLLDLGHHQAAYNMVGLALRIAQSLNYMDGRHRGQQVCQLFRRLWWTLIHLDYRCSRYVGKPVTTNIDDLLYLMPSREPQDVHLSNGLLYHTESIRLTAAALVVNEAIGHRSFLDGAVDPTQLEERAETLSNHLHYIEEWRKDLPRDPSFANITTIHINTLVNSPDPESSSFNNDLTTQPPPLTILTTLLHLQYHNTLMTLHRVFIQFPTSPSPLEPHPKANAHAATSLHHAMSMIKTTHDRMTITDSLHGLSELYQYQWNAAITIIGFLLAYPFCPRCTAAREHLLLALEIFDAAGAENSTARRAAALTRALCGKVDALVQILRGSGRQPMAPSVPGSTGLMDTDSSPSRSQDQRADLSSRSRCPAIAAHTAGEGTPGRDALPDAGEELWPWADLINLDSWPDYCDGVSEVFLDPAAFMDGAAFGTL
ncbi:putative transcription factor [Aspergillus mulundensis]|uniref:Zn(2)-C6 fungal-type domain-containing protein n=1 Tax=Aspergillus mulundensis TaxID=1810919 RepID=A0A3D8R0T5_9EURO|nr:Uncharacterized protein DSM5745_09310 [Aspergillus mulundensis]RDW67444.1 Uncharacterized protein DSM5745_09310 [Aspergillus mulundensis]